MRNTVPWILLGVLVLLLLLFLAVLPARRAEETKAPTPVEYQGDTPLLPTSVPTATPTALTPAQEELTDLESETVTLDADADLDADLVGLEQELKGL